MPYQAPDEHNLDGRETAASAPADGVALLCPADEISLDEIERIVI